MMRRRTHIRRGAAILLTCMAIMALAPAALAGVTEGYPDVTAAGQHFTIATTFDTGFAIREDGTLWAWGDAGYLFGDGREAGSETPVQVLADAASIRTDGNAAYALKDDGTVWACGYFLADNVAGGPVVWTQYTQIMEGVSAIAAAYEHAGVYAIKENGDLVYWTYAYLNFGGSSVTADIVDGEVAVLDDVAQFMPFFTPDESDEYWPNGNTCYAVKNDGTLWAWTHDSFTAPPETPVEVTENVADIVAAFVNPALDADGNYQLAYRIILAKPNGKGLYTEPAVATVQNVAAVATDGYGTYLLLRGDGTLASADGDVLTVILDGVRVP